MEEELKVSRFSRLRQVWRDFFQKYRKPIFVIGPLLLLAIFSGIIWFTVGRIKPAADDTTQPTITKKEPPALVPHLLNGEMVSPDIAKRHPVAVMIENSPAARPQAGLTDADVVYEAVTEGGITRFMGIYSQNYPTKAGPVRSARSYFIDWLSEFDAFYAHAGGSPTALNRIGQYGIKDYPHSNDAYQRIPQAGVASEHTLFVDVSKIFQFGVEKKGWSAEADFQSWKFIDVSTAFGLVPSVTLNFSSGQFQVIWTHDAAKNMYQRAMGGIAHKDRTTGEQISARTVVVMTVAHSANPPYSGTGKESEWNMTTIGSGAASVFQEGNRIDGTWKKPSRTERTRFYDTAGTEIELVRGKIWVEVIPQDGSIVAPPVTPTT